MSTTFPTESRRVNRRAKWAGAAIAVSLLAACSGGASDLAERDPSSAESSSGTTTADSNSSNERPDDGGELFDSSVVHDIEVTFDQAEYDAMIATFRSSGDKEWITATISIDGVTLKDVGLRLKGNSSLMGLRTNAGTGNRAGGPGGNVSADSPNTLPWLVRLDKNIDGQSYEGYTEFVIRSNNTSTALNEAVALELIGLSGQATQKAFSTRFSVNGGAEVLRLAIENPADEWDDENFANDGVLYKAESGGDYSYRGDDPEAYDEIFDQETDTDDENFKPLTDFLKFINTADDANLRRAALATPRHRGLRQIPRRPGTRREPRRHRRPGQQLIPPLRLEDGAHDDRVVGPESVIWQPRRWRAAAARHALGWFPERMRNPHRVLRPRRVSAAPDPPAAPVGSAAGATSWCSDSSRTAPSRRSIRRR